MTKIQNILSPKVLSWINTFITDFGIDVVVALITLAESGDVTLAAITSIVSATARIYMKKATAKGVKKLKDLKSKEL